MAFMVSKMSGNVAPLSAEGSGGKTAAPKVDKETTNPKYVPEPIIPEQEDHLHLRLCLSC